MDHSPPDSEPAKGSEPPAMGCGGGAAFARRASRPAPSVPDAIFGRPANDQRSRPSPLTIAGGGPAGALRLPLRPRRIIVAVDFSPGGERARAIAEALARSSDAVLDLVHVLDAFDHIFVRGHSDLLADPDAVLAGVDHALESRARVARRAGVRCVANSLVGAPGVELSRHATRTRADLMVVGAPDERGDSYRSGWGARAIQQLLRLARWTGVIVQVRP